MDPVKPLEQAPEDELTPSTEETTFGDILSQFEQETAEVPEKQMQLHGTVVGVNGNVVYVDVNRKSDGIISLEDLRAGGVEEVEPGTKLLVSVTGTNEEGNPLLSLVRAERPKDYSALEAAFQDKRTIAGRVVEPVKGGLRVDVGMRAFMPASRSGVRNPTELPGLVGQEIQVRVIKLDVASEDCVVDRRVVLEDEASEARRRAFEEKKEGDVVEGTVRTVTDFGAFVDIGGVDGLLHVTDMSWSRVGKPSDVVKPGDPVQVKILKINPETRKVSLGMKQLAPDPWSVAAEKYAVGQRVQGTVSRLTDFGAFVEIEPGVDGLIHISEMSWSRKMRKPSDVLKAGDQVDVVVLDVKPGEHRIALGLKQALGDPWDEAPTRFPVGQVVEGPVVNIQKFGAFVDLGDGFEGMIHIADITREKRLEHPREVLSVGNSVRAAVTEVDREKRRIRLSMKQLEPTALDHYITEHNVGDVVSGRLLEVNPNKARVELSEGVVAQCRLAQQDRESERAAAAERNRADIASSVAMLTAKFKQGATPEAEAKRPEPLRPGQVRTFRISNLNPETKRVEVELVS